MVNSNHPILSVRHAIENNYIGYIKPLNCERSTVDCDSCAVTVGPKGEKMRIAIMPFPQLWFDDLV